jgi:hypothetical protein
MAAEPEWIELARTGGFANITMRSSVSADVLGPREREGVNVLLSREPVKEAVIGEPDRFGYDVTVVAGKRRHRVRLAEREIDERLRPLIDCLERDSTPATRRPT